MRLSQGIELLIKHLKDYNIIVMKMYLIGDSKLYIFNILLCVCLYEFVCIKNELVPVQARGHRVLMVLELQVVGSCLIWALGTKPRSFTKAVRALNCCIISLHHSELCHYFPMKWLALSHTLLFSLVIGFYVDQLALN